MTPICMGLALCLHDEGGRGRLATLEIHGRHRASSDVTDNTLSSSLVVLDNSSERCLGHSTRRDEVQARILAHALPPTEVGDRALLW